VLPVLALNSSIYENIYIIQFKLALELVKYLHLSKTLFKSILDLLPLPFDPLVGILYSSMMTPQQTPFAGSMTVSDRAHLHHGPNFGTQGQSETESSPTIQLDEHDPMHPYNMGLLRKWLAVATVSTGSLCV
jgi:hypothetical protein